MLYPKQEPNHRRAGNKHTHKYSSEAPHMSTLDGLTDFMSSTTRPSVDSQTLPERRFRRETSAHRAAPMIQTPTVGPLGPFRVWGSEIQPEPKPWRETSGKHPNRSKLEPRPWRETSGGTLKIEHSVVRP